MRRIVSTIFVGLALAGYGLQIARGQSGSCGKAFNYTLDDSERPLRIDESNGALCTKETVRFSFAPSDSIAFPFNGQSFSTSDGITVTQLFQRNMKLDLSFMYTIGHNTLLITVERLSQSSPATK